MFGYVLLWIRSNVDVSPMDCRSASTLALHALPTSFRQATFRVANEMPSAERAESAESPKLGGELPSPPRNIRTAIC